MKTTWDRRSGVVALIGGLLLARSGLGVTPAAAPPVKEDALADLTQNWDKNLPSGSRLPILSSLVNSSGVPGAAVRDNNTGLVINFMISGTAALLAWYQSL